MLSYTSSTHLFSSAAVQDVLTASNSLQFVPRITLSEKKPNKG